MTMAMTGAAAAALGLAAIIVPLAWFTHPAMLDHPFELARIAILARVLEGSAAPDDHVVLGWRLPNMLGDVLGALLAMRLPVEAAARAVWGLALGMQVLGAAALGAALGHARPALIAAIASVAVHNHIAALGFTNFQIGVGLSLLALASWLWLRDRSRALGTAFAALMSPVIASAHLCAWLGFGAAIAGVMLVEMVRRRSTVTFIEALALAAAMLATTVGWLWPWFALAMSEQSPTWSMSAKLGGVAGFFLFDPTWRGMAWGAAVLFAAALAIRRHGWRADPRVVAMVGCLLALVAVLPTHSETTLHLDMRVLLPVVLIAVAGFVPSVIDAAGARVLAIAVLVLHVLRIALYAPVWSEVDTTLRQIAAAADALPKPVVVFVARGVSEPADGGEAWSPPIHHAAAILAVRPGVHVPQVWAERGQTIITRPAWLASARRLQGANPRELRSGADLDRLLAAMSGGIQHPSGTRAATALLVLSPRRMGGGDASAVRSIAPSASGRDFLLLVPSSR